MIVSGERTQFDENWPRFSCEQVPRDGCLQSDIDRRPCVQTAGWHARRLRSTPDIAVLMSIVIIALFVNVVSGLLVLAKGP